MWVGKDHMNGFVSCFNYFMALTFLLFYVITNNFVSGAPNSQER